MREQELRRDSRRDSRRGNSAAPRDDKRISFANISVAERAARWVIWRVRGVGFVRFLKLLDAAGGELAALFGRDEPAQSRLLEGVNIRAKTKQRLLARLQCVDPEAEYLRELDALDALGPSAQLIALGDAAYPRRLRDLREPPLFIYVRGDLDTVAFDESVALVGSRAVTCSQAAMARRLGEDLARAGVATVSGGALGVDAAAHRGCLDAGAPSVAVLAGGVDHPSPRRNSAIFERIIEQGALISEYPLGVKPRPYHFQRRNELIAALSCATVVVRARLKSGTMLTARAAASLGRPICAMPGAPDAPLAAGCNQLLVEGAACVRDARDILAHVFGAPAANQQLRLESPGQTASSIKRRPSPSAPKPAREPVDLSAFSADARALFEALQTLAGDAARDVERDTLKRHIDWPESRLCPAMLELELGGAIHKKAGANRFRPA